MPKVFVVNEPMTVSPVTKLWTRALDLSPAVEYGELVFLLPPGPVQLDYSAVAKILAVGLSGYAEGDFVLPIGDMAASTLAVAQVALQTGGAVRLLRWVSRQRCYTPVSVQLENRK